MVVTKYYTVSGTITQMNKLANSLAGYVDTEISNIMDDVERDAQNNARKRTGRMAAMTVKEKFQKGNGIGYKIEGKAPYTVYQHEGTRYIKGDPYIKNAFEKHKGRVKLIKIDRLLSGGGGGGFSSSGW